MKAIRDNDAEALASLGLRFLQSKVYLALVTSESLTIREISKMTGVARQDLYRITSELQKLGLIEKIIAAPTAFRAIGLEEGTSILLQRMHEKEVEARKKRKKLVERYKNKTIKTPLQGEGSKFILISEKDVVWRLKRMTENTRTSLDIITTLKRFNSANSGFYEVDNRALKRGVKFRFILGSDNGDNVSLPKMVKAAMKERPFEIRYTNNPICAIIAIIDRREVVSAVSPHAAISEVPILLSNNPCLIEIFQKYFETMWNEAIEFKSSQT
jgi:sugar-specific transcriptional regulator TrmB